MARKETYEKALFDTMNLDSDTLLSGTYNGTIEERMKETIAIEGPIRKSLLYKRVLNSFSLQKVGSRLLSLFDSISSTLTEEVTKDEDGEEVFHSSKEEDFFRPSPSSDDRYSYQIPHREAANTIIYILENSDRNSWNKSDLYRSFISEMGWEKSGRAIEELFGYALKDKRIRRSGNGRILK